MDIYVFGEYPTVTYNYLKERGLAPDIKDGDTELLKAGKPDFMGLNYYQTKNVAFNYKDKNIRCNAVAPGRVETNLRVNSENLIGSKTAHDKSIDNWRDIETKVSEGYITNMRKCTPDEIAKVVLFLASDEASFVNGSIFVADGGWTSY